MPLLFDMDGLLLDTEKVALETFEDVAAGFGFFDVRDFFLTLVGSSGKQTDARVAEHFGPEVDVEKFRADWHVGFARRMEHDVPIKPGVSDAIEALSAKGTVMAVVTSTGTARARDHLREAGLLKHFRDVVGGDAVSQNKPHPDPYIEGAARIGLAAESCFAFEDSDKGVASATAAGCTVSQIPDLRPADQPLPELGQQVFADLRSALEARGFL